MDWDRLLLLRGAPDCLKAGKLCRQKLYFKVRSVAERHKLHHGMRPGHPSLHDCGEVTATGWQVMCTQSDLHKRWDNESLQCDPCISSQASLALVEWEELAGHAQLRPCSLVNCCSKRASLAMWHAMSGAVDSTNSWPIRCSPDPAAGRMAIAQESFWKQCCDFIFSHPSCRS